MNLSSWRDQENRRKIGSIPCRVPREQGVAGTQRMSANEEVGQRRGLGPTSFAIFTVRRRRDHTCFKRQRLTYKKGWSQPLIQTRPIKLKGGTDLGAHDRIDHQQTGSLCLLQLSRRPNQPIRIASQNIQPDICIDEHRHDQSSPRVSRSSSSVVHRAVARPVLAVSHVAKSSLVCAAAGTAFKKGTVSSNSSTVPAVKPSLRRIGSGMKSSASTVRMDCIPSIYRTGDQLATPVKALTLAHRP